MIKIIIATTITTIKTPTPTPALNIPSITEQPVNTINTIKSINSPINFLFIISIF
ncbi:hypothetical protein ACFX5D_14895 [Flavobacterium sp. LB3P45]|uniref:Uncharacterized protein n=1 Tax=Flavobacterium fructosi TaxID=3230416 RepID=A0ABW6HQB8_9FLAO